MLKNKIVVKTLLVFLLIGLGVSCSNHKGSDNLVSATDNSTIANDTTKLIDEYLSKISSEKNFSGGLLIVKDGKRIFSKGYGWANKESNIPFTSGTLASMGSITKAFTATAIIKLEEQNKLSLEDKLRKYFPLIPSDKADITIHQLLTHSSGFHEFLKEDDGDYEIINTEQFLKRAFSEPLAFKPGEKAVYTNVGFSILGIIIEQVSGMEYEQYLKTNLFDPLGIKKISYCYPNSNTDTIAVGYQNGKKWGTHQQHFENTGGGPFWNLKANGGLEASLEDMFLWINNFTNNSILKESSIQKMFTPHIQEEGYNGKSAFGYGCNISQSRRNTKMIDNGGSNGIYYARMIRLPEEGIVFYMVTNESAINAMMVLPNVTQLYFKGKIEQDALTMQPMFQNELSKKIYEILKNPMTTDLAKELSNEKVKVDNDMVLWEVGQKLIQENRNKEAVMLYTYYTKTFPNIVVAWNDLGDVYLAENNKNKAISCYKQALKVRPGNPRAMEALKKLKR
jgi:CubicO group peptidase (beta-lactamase class C family)